MIVRHSMSSPVFTLPPDRPIDAAMRDFRIRRIRRAPVVENGDLVGIVSERDLLDVLPGTLPQLLAVGEAALDTPVRDVMSSDVHTVGPDQPLETAAAIMLEQRVGGVPVVDEGGLVGIITESDIFRTLWDVLTFDGGKRLLVRERAGSDGAPKDYVTACVHSGCSVRTLLHRHLDDGSVATLLIIEGPEADGVADAIRGRDNVLSVETLGKG
jgi:acetoin utilization protein AcuB